MPIMYVFTLCRSRFRFVGWSNTSMYVRGVDLRSLLFCACEWQEENHFEAIVPAFLAGPTPFLSLILFTIFTSFHFSSFSFFWFCFTSCEGLEEDHFDAIMPALLACLDPSNGCCPRVVHRTLLALVQVLEAGPEGGVLPHSETLLERCERLGVVLFCFFALFVPRFLSR